MVTSRIWRRIPTGTAESGELGPLQIRVVTSGGEGAVEDVILYSAEIQGVHAGLASGSVGFCGKNAARFRCWGLPEIYRWSGSRKVRDEAPSSNVDIKTKQFPDRAESSLSRCIPEPAQIIRASTAGTPMIRGKSTETRDPTRISDRPSRSNRVIERGVRGAQ